MHFVVPDFLSAERDGSPAPAISGDCRCSRNRSWGHIPGLLVICLEELIIMTLLPRTSSCCKTMESTWLTSRSWKLLESALSKASKWWPKRSCATSRAFPRRRWTRWRRRWSKSVGLILVSVQLSSSLKQRVYFSSTTILKTFRLRPQKSFKRYTC